MNWAEIKKAVNSTALTEDMKPLDELIPEKIGLQKINTVSTQYVASDTVISTIVSGTVKLTEVYSSSSYGNSSTSTYLGAFTPDAGGSLRIKASLSSDVSSRTAILVMTENSTSIDTGITLGSTYYSSTLSKDITIAAGKTYRFYLKLQTTANNDSYSVYISNLTIGGTLSVTEDNGVGMRTVKHIQRGIITPTSSTSFTVSLSGFENSQKMVAFVDGTFYCSNSYELQNKAIVSSLTRNTLTIRRTGAPNGTSYESNSCISYQVIEFV